MNNNLKNLFNRTYVLLSMGAGAFGYLIIFYIIDPSYLTPHTTDFLGDVFVFCLFVILFSAFLILLWVLSKKTLHKDKLHPDIQKRLFKSRIFIIIFQIVLFASFFYISDTNMWNLKNTVDSLWGSF